MPYQFKKGDLALITQSSDLDDVGRVVTVVEPALGKPFRWKRAIYPLGWVLVRLAGRCEMFDPAILMPLWGDFAPGRAHLAYLPPKRGRA